MHLGLLIGAKIDGLGKPAEAKQLWAPSIMENDRCLVVGPTQQRDGSAHFMISRSKAESMDGQYTLKARMDMIPNPG